jgi:hypothetical protein
MTLALSAVVVPVGSPLYMILGFDQRGIRGTSTAFGARQSMWDGQCESGAGVRVRTDVTPTEVTSEHTVSGRCSLRELAGYVLRQLTDLCSAANHCEVPDSDILSITDRN